MSAICVQSHVVVLMSLGPERAHYTARAVTFRARLCARWLDADPMQRPLLPSPPVHEQLGFVGEVKVDDVVQQRDVDAARGHVRDHQHATLARPESREVGVSDRLLQRAVDGVGADTALRTE